METKVVNLKHEPYDVYIGRKFNKFSESIWHNPFHIGPDGGRKEVIAKYKKYLMNNTELMSRLKELKGKRLGCFCKPLACHGDILVELIKELDI